MPQPPPSPVPSRSVANSPQGRPARRRRRDPMPGRRGGEEPDSGERSQGGEDHDATRLCRHRIVRHPPSVLEDMTRMAAWLAHRGWHLHSGGAAGADSAFAAGAPPGARALFLPWPGYRGNEGPDCCTLSFGRMPACLAIASALHPAWHRCSPAARRLHARNAAILLGQDAHTPVHAVVAWTSRGQVSGGTGMGIQIAHDRGIPVLNLGVLHPRAVCERLEEFRASVSPGSPHA